MTGHATSKRALDTLTGLAFIAVMFGFGVFGPFWVYWLGFGMSIDRAGAFNFVTWCIVAAVGFVLLVAHEVGSAFHG